MAHPCQEAWNLILESMANGCFPSTVASWLSDPTFQGSDGSVLPAGVSVMAHLKDSAGITLLHYAAAYGDESTVRLLLSHNASIHARNMLGDTPADDARSFGHLALLPLLTP